MDFKSLDEILNVNQSIESGLQFLKDLKPGTKVKFHFGNSLTETSAVNEVAKDLEYIMIEAYPHTGFTFRQSLGNLFSRAQDEGFGLEVRKHILNDRITARLVVPEPEHV